jgi:23S rRNA (guanine745-N1)-methyltransferase
VLACPLCRLALEPVEAKTFGCATGHRFDRAKEGHVNLLRPGRVRKERSGDDKEMVRDRRAFLQAGHYRAGIEALAQVVDGFRPRTVVDVGCGEGSFTDALTQRGRDVVAFDLSVEAVRLAARLLGDRATCVVASVNDIPVLDHAADVVVSAMSPVHEPEFRRIGRPGGRVVLLSPGAEHLDGLRRVLYQDYRPHDEVVALAGAEPARKVTASIELEGDDILRVWGMTPYRWNAPAEGVERLRVLDRLEVTMSFVVSVLDL